MKRGRPRQVERVARSLRAQLPSLCLGGDRMPTVRTLAARFGVSVETLRAAQALLAQEGLLEIRHGSGVFLTESARPRWIGIYSNLDVLHPATSHYHRQVIWSLRQWLQARQVQTEVYVGESKIDENRELCPASRFARDVAEGKLDGLALLSVPASTAWKGWVAQLTIPVVGALSAFEVSTDYDHMVYEGIRILREQGSERIALLCWDFLHLQKPFEQVLAEAGCAYHPDWVRGNLHPMLKGAGWEEFREIWASRREKPDGLLVGDDLLFAEACVAIQEMGIRVPEQLRLVTHANKGATQALPLAHTRLEIDPEEQAEAYGEMLLALMRGETPSHEHSIITCKVVSMPGVVNNEREARRAAVEPDVRDGSRAQPCGTPGCTDGAVEPAVPAGLRRCAGRGTAGTAVSRGGGVHG